jgi:hypothetical protein
MASVTWQETDDVVIAAQGRKMPRFPDGIGGVKPDSFREFRAGSSWDIIHN